MAIYICTLALTLVGCYVHVAAEETITVKPGDDLQAAIDKLHDDYDGGRVIFSKGTYTINQSLMVYSNIVLQGDPNEATQDIVLEIDPSNTKYNGNIINHDDKKYNISNVAIINLKFVGNIQEWEQHYPSCCHTSPSNCSCNPPCSEARDNFVAIAGDGCGTTLETACNRNYTLKDLIITGFAMGATMGGFRDVLVDNVEAYNNGLIESFYHNLYFRRDFNMTLTNIKSHNSPTGNGINLSQGSDYTAYNNLFYNNYFRGFRIYGEDGVTIYNIDVHNITCTNNSDYGFLFANIDNGVVYHNIATKSGNANEKDSNCHNVTFKDNQW